MLVRHGLLAGEEKGVVPHGSLSYNCGEKGSRHCYTFGMMGRQSHVMVLVIHVIFRVYTTHFRGITAPQCSY